MQVTITLNGPQGSGKTVLAEFIQRQLGSHLGVPCEVRKGGNPRGPEYDTVIVQTTPEALRAIANHP